MAGGLRPDHLVHVAFGYGLFTGGFGLHQGIERVGAGIVPVAGGNTPRQVMLLRDLRPDVLVCTPSYALHIAEVARAGGGDPRALGLSFGHFGGEPWTEEMRVEIERELGIRAFNNYGLSEVIGPGVSGECAARAGMHVAEDHFLVECVDPSTLAPVPDGTVGELVFTSLTKEAMPILRYRTRDLASLDRSPCPCGRTGVRMSRVVGRSDDMFIVRGVNVFPSQIEEALLRVEGAAPHYVIEIARPGTLDEAVVRVEIRPRDFSDEMRQMVALRDRIDHEIHSITGIRMTIELVAPSALGRSEGKARRVIDHRRAGGTRRDADAAAAEGPADRVSCPVPRPPCRRSPCASPAAPSSSCPSPGWPCPPPPPRSSRSARSSRSPARPPSWARPRPARSRCSPSRPTPGAAWPATR